MQIRTRITAQAPRVLYLPNESDEDGDDAQIGGRTAFREMASDGTIKALSIFSFLVSYRRSGKNISASHRELLDEVNRFKPDLIFWSHPDYYVVTRDLISSMRELSPNVLLVYHEGDPFDRWYKRLGDSQRCLYAASDVFFTVGLGAGRRLFERICPHRRLYHTTSYTERERFGDKPAAGLLGSRFDAVMIGNIPRRLKVFLHPGASERIRLARGLSRLFGDRFACYGSGWPAGTRTAGPVNHVTQRDIIQTSRLSLMWEHFPEYSFYFSDRLPIALAAGVPFVTSARAGHDVLLANVPGLFQAACVEDAIDIAAYLRSISLEKIAELGEAARQWVLDHLEARVVFRRMMQTCIECYRQGVELRASDAR